MYAGQIVETGDGRRGLPRAAPSVHARPAAVGARLRRRPRAALVDSRARRPTWPRRRRVPVPPALRVRAERLPPRRDPADRARRGPRDAVPPPRGLRGRRAARAGDRRWLRRLRAVLRSSRCSTCGSRCTTRCAAESSGGCAGCRRRCCARSTASTSTIAKGETLGLVGESGCGKSTLGRCIVGLYEPTAGEVRYDGEALRREARAGRAPADPDGLPGPVLVAEPAHDGASRRWPSCCARTGWCRRRQIDERCRELLDLVGLGPRALDAHPRQFSGGQRQRVAIARALALEPELLVADEPVSALDVSVQATVLNLLEDLREKLGLTVLLIAHNMAVVRHVRRPRRGDVPGPDRRVGADGRSCSRTRGTRTRRGCCRRCRGSCRAGPRRRSGVVGDPPSPIDLPTGCRFHPRCPIAQEPLCSTEDPALAAGPGRPDHVAACHFAWQRDPRGSNMIERRTIVFPHELLAGLEHPAFEAQGAKDGPRLSLIGGIHGCEYSSIAAVTRFMNELDTSELAGTITAVPVVSMQSFRRRSPFVVPEDGKNLNRSFPGSLDGTYTDVLARSIFDELIAPADVLHRPARRRHGRGAGAVRDLRRTPCRRSTPGARHRGRVRLPYVVREERKEGGLGGMTIRRRRRRRASRRSSPRPAAAASSRRTRCELLVAGVRNVLRHLEMLPGEPGPPARRQRIVGSFVWLRSAQEGWWDAAVGAGDEVAEGGVARPHPQSLGRRARGDPRAARRRRSLQHDEPGGRGRRAAAGARRRPQRRPS